MQFLYWIVLEMMNCKLAGTVKNKLLTYYLQE